jgi:hypothetical protein
MFELGRPALLVDHSGGMTDVPHLAFDVEVAPIYALSEMIVETAEVSAALAVDPAEILDVVRAFDAVRVGETEPPATQSAATVVKREIVLD